MCGRKKTNASGECAGPRGFTECACSGGNTNQPTKGEHQIGRVHFYQCHRHLYTNLVLLTVSGRREANATGEFVQRHVDLPS